MRRYFFHLHGQSATLLDREGQVLPDASAAQAEARRYVDGLAHQRGGQAIVQMAVQDAAGAVVCRVPVHAGGATV